MTNLYRPTQDEIDHAAEQMTTTYTKDGKRIARAAALIAAGAVDYVSQGIGWSVNSQRNPPKFEEDGENFVDTVSPEPVAYQVTSTKCECYDHLIRASAIGTCGAETTVVRPACKHIYAVQMYIRIVAAKLHEAIETQFSSVYAIETRMANLFAVYDRKSDVAICGAIYSVKTGTYRPETGQDAADFSRWLVAQPVEVDYFPGGLLERVLRTCPADSLTLRADVYYGSPRTYVLSGYRWDGCQWVNLEHSDRQEFTEAGWNALLGATGFVLGSRPVKQSGCAYHYLLTRDTGEPVVYSLHSAAQSTVERQRQEYAFAEIRERSGADAGAGI